MVFSMADVWGFLGCERKGERGIFVDEDGPADGRGHAMDLRQALK